MKLALSQRFTSLLSVSLLLAVTCSAVGQAAKSPAAQDLTVSQATVAFTPGQGALNTLKDALYQAHSTVDVAAFRLTHQGLIDALCYLSAEKKVKVRVFLNRDSQRLEDGGEVASDSENVLPAEPSYQSIYQKLIRNGVQVYVEADESKMHLRCAVIDSQTVLTGSCNWTPENFKKKYDDVLVLQSPSLAQVYMNKINSLVARSEALPSAGPLLRPDIFTFPSDHQDRQRKPSSKRQVLQEPTTITKPFTVSVYFSPEQPGFDSMLSQIEQATKSVDVAMRWVTNLDFGKRLAAVAAKRSVPVRLLVTKDMFEEEHRWHMDRLTASGVKVFASKPKMNMHWKVAVIDGRWLWTGSANATPRAEDSDQEDLLCADSPELASCYEAAYEGVIPRLDTVVPKQSN